jgi:acetyltransferase-like isoleucine patch superfamily enzyme
MLRIVRAVHGRQDIVPDPPFETEFVQELSRNHDSAEILAIFRRFSRGDDYIDELMRRVCVRALTRKCGEGLRIGTGVGLRHPETFEIGSGVVIGEQTLIHGRFDGSCRIGNKVWIGAQSYFDARCLVLEDDVGWGPGAKVLGSEHTGVPRDLPIIATDLQIAPVRVEAGADVGVNAVILPGVTIGRGSIVGAGAVVTRDVPPFAIVAGLPARIISWRDGSDDKQLNARMIGALP